MMFVIIDEEEGLPDATFDDQEAADAYALWLNDGAIGLEEDARYTVHNVDHNPGVGG